MFKTLLESLIIETQEQNKDLKQTIASLYNNINSNYTTDLHKEILESQLTLEDIFKLTNTILQDSDFIEELQDLDLKIPSIITKY